MASIYHTNWSYYDNYSWNSTLGSFLAGKDNRFVYSSSDNTIRFDNKFSFYVIGDTWGRPTGIGMKYDIDDSRKTVYSSNPYWATSGTCYVTAILDEKYAYITLQRGDGSSARIAFLIFITDSNNINICANALQGYNTNLNSSTIYDCIDPSKPAYKFAHVANYKMDTPNIAYSPKVPIIISSGDTTIDFASCIIDCSNMNYESTVTVNGKNYYCIGTNTLIKLDSN